MTRRDARVLYSGAGDSLAGRTVLQIIPRMDAGGAERTMIDVAAALTEAGAIAKVASEGGRLVSELQARGGLWLPFPAASKNPIAMALNARRLARLMRDEGVDLVHARSRAPAWVALRAARMSGTPFVTTYHGAYSGRSALKLLYNSVMARGDVVIANSQWTADQIEKLHPFAREKIVVAPRGVDLRAFSPAAIESDRVQRLRAQWGCEPDARIILLAARLTAWKGHRELIEAMRILISQGSSDVVAIFAGDPQGRSGYVKELDQQILAAGLADRVRRVGHCTDMPAALLAAAAVVAPSTRPEAFGRTAVEAQAMGVPVVASDLGAAPETIAAPPEVAARERTGWRAPAGDAKALAAALTEILSLGASARDALSLRARVRVQSRYSLEAMTQRTLDAYRTLLDPLSEKTAPATTGRKRG